MTFAKGCDWLGVEHCPVVVSHGGFEVWILQNFGWQLSDGVGWGGVGFFMDLGCIFFLSPKFCCRAQVRLYTQKHEVSQPPQQKRLQTSFHFSQKNTTLSSPFLVLEVFFHKHFRIWVVVHWILMWASCWSRRPSQGGQFFMKISSFARFGTNSQRPSIRFDICSESFALNQHNLNVGVEPKIGGKPQNGWFIMETPIKMDDLGSFPYFWKHPCVYHTFAIWQMYVTTIHLTEQFWLVDDFHIHVLHLCNGVICWISFKLACSYEHPNSLSSRKHGMYPRKKTPSYVAL